MYIWVILATIMVALSFFNLSPRQDRDRSVNEIKAATVVNRFKSEHLAMAKYMECEIIKQTNNSDWDGPEAERSSSLGPVEVSYNHSSTKPILSYVKLEDYLPQGYAYSDTVAVKHYIYCLDGVVEYEGDPNRDPLLGQNGGGYVESEGDGSLNYKACNLTSYRYLVSYAYIPDKWLNKSASRTPVPLFMSFVSKPTSGGSTYGWTDCATDGCLLKGYSAKAGKLLRDENKTQIIEYTLLSDDSILWSEAKNYCDKKPCLFAYMRFPVSDVANFCYNLMQKEEGEEEPEIPGGEEGDES